mmetsp:Transcript_38898/g.111163  ORF Transcript_38898/g.111163 Transcript_38898/m.111163 type:complete len:169 (-) Transcript_38898:3613-4119(-)
MRGFSRELCIDYRFVKINNSTDRMIEVMRGAYNDPATLRELKVIPLGSDTSALKACVVGPVKESVAATSKRLTLRTGARPGRGSVFAGPTEGWLESIAEESSNGAAPRRAQRTRGEGYSIHVAATQRSTTRQTGRTRPSSSTSRRPPSSSTTSRSPRAPSDTPSTWLR